MSAACLLVGATTLTFSSATFDLSWTHSVEKTEWRESWVAEAGALRLVEAAVKGSGAGMEPDEGAYLQNGWWVWTPQLPPAPSLSLATSGATGGGWRICDATTCNEFGVEPGQALVLKPCGSENG